MRERGERDSQRCAFNDFALVALAPADAARVNPTVPALGGPIGVDTDGLRKGEPVAELLAERRPRRSSRARSLGDDESGLLHYVATRPPGIPGDSGSGFLDGHGAAFGVLSTEFDDAQHSNGVDRPRRRAGVREPLRPARPGLARARQRAVHVGLAVAQPNGPGRGGEPPARRPAPRRIARISAVSPSS